jgi:hypothetical protein
MDSSNSQEYPELDGSHALQPQEKVPDYIRKITGRNWNEEFQQLIEKAYDDTEYELTRMKQLRKLLKEFAETATQIGIGNFWLFFVLFLLRSQ